ncbi:hypothetical protein ED312_14440 [Sinomicrobium pectinilyticum]|uniref:Uncharacterized protein n=2 Tax=Sinomicrobium pectinilyticum TaxID=1084421 RepID=A0A3N0E7U3_SINP1|nr:hypothetical protein ED312_14440 [Sinomicrobium pectinilyticum]
MNTYEKKLIESRKHYVKDYHPILQPPSIFKDKFQIRYFYIEGHADLLLTARAFIYLCQKVNNLGEIPRKYFSTQASEHLKSHFITDVLNSNDRSA